jgi:hypothetical protein
MGTLYKEIVAHKNQRGIKMVLLLGLAILSINTIVLLSSLRNIFEEFLIISYAIMPLVAIYMAYSWKKCNKKYRYTIIDRELIIDKLSGSKRKSVLNINTKHIVKIEKCKSKKQKEKLYKQYSFLCSGNKGCAYNCIYEKNGKLYGFNFEPSTELYNKLVSMANCRKIA